MAKHPSLIGLTLIVGLLLAFPTSAAAQFLSWDDFLEQLYMEAEEQGAVSAIENLYDELQYHHANPININQADSIELQRLGFLTEKQIKGIHHYIYRYGQLHGIGELMLIPELDYHTRQMLSYFIYFGEAAKREGTDDTWQRMLTKGRSELSSRLDIPLYNRAGYAPRTQSQLDASPSRYYTGNALYHNIRYVYRYDTKFSWGFSTEKDAGEPLFPKATPLPDHLSGYIQLGDMGILKNLVIGNYRLQFGQGLILNTDFALGKNMALQGLGRQTTPIKPHRSTSEAAYYTGAAATIAWDTWQLTTFASYRKLDATLDGAAISTLKTDGYHRTPLELARRGNTRSNLFGAHLGYATHGFHLGATAIYQSFNRLFAQHTEGYKRYAPQGHTFYNASIDYAWHHHRLSIIGETAIDKKGSIATINTLRLKATDRLYLTLLQRHYAHDYWALESKSYSSSSDICNERGLYLGADWQPHRRFQLTAYADAYHFPYLRYRVSAPSYGSDGAITARYSTNSSNLLLRYRYRLKQRDATEGFYLPEGGLVNEWTHRLRLQWDSSPLPTLTYQAQIEGCLAQCETQSSGFLFGINASYKPATKTHELRLSSGLTYFHADYAARLYGYERGLLYAYNYQSFYGTGLRYYLLLQYNHKRMPQLILTGKLGASYYFDRTTIGSGASLIEANHREDLQLQVRYKF